MSPSLATWLHSCLTVLLVTGWLPGQAHAQEAGAPPPLPDLAAALFRNGGVPASVRFDLRRTASGWRVDDLHSATTPSLRAQMASCAAARR